MSLLIMPKTIDFSEYFCRRKWRMSVWQYHNQWHQKCLLGQICSPLWTFPSTRSNQPCSKKVRAMLKFNSALPTAIIWSLKVSNSEGAVVKTGVATFPLLRYLHLIVDFLNDFDELILKIPNFWFWTIFVCLVEV